MQKTENVISVSFTNKDAAAPSGIAVFLVPQGAQFDTANVESYPQYETKFQGADNKFEYKVDLWECSKQKPGRFRVYACGTKTYDVGGETVTDYGRIAEITKGVQKLGYIIDAPVVEAV